VDASWPGFSTSPNTSSQLRNSNGNLRRGPAPASPRVKALARNPEKYNPQGTANNNTKQAENNAIAG
jgi:hypothetical protein